MSNLELRRHIARDLVGCPMDRQVPTVHLNSSCADLVKAFNLELRSREPETTRTTRDLHLHRDAAMGIEDRKPRPITTGTLDGRRRRECAEDVATEMTRELFADFLDEMMVAADGGSGAVNMWATTFLSNGPRPLQ